MNYENMTFTDNDRARLKENKKAIIDWIMENIVPHMDEDARFVVDFGDEYRCPRTHTPIENYHFGVYGSEHTFYSGGGTKSKGYIGFGEKFGRIGYAIEKVNSPWELFPIVDNWKYIKSNLLRQLDQAKQNRKAIYEFEV